MREFEVTPEQLAGLVAGQRRVHVHARDPRVDEELLCPGDHVSIQAKGSPARAFARVTWVELHNDGRLVVLSLDVRMSTSGLRAQTG